MILRSEFLKTFSILQNLDKDDFRSLLVLSGKITNIIIDREDFDDESKGELIQMFEAYIYNYHTLGLSYVHVSLNLPQILIFEGLPLPRKCR